jgi:preprotein translocase subunit SecG
MQALQTILLVVHVLLALMLIGLILLQRGPGATAGAAFGSGASSTVFGARGSASFLTRTTAILAVLFFANCMFLAYRYGQVAEQVPLMERAEAAQEQTRQPSAPAQNAQAPAADLPEPPVDDPPATEPAQSEVPSTPPVDN